MKATGGGGRILSIKDGAESHGKCHLCRKQKMVAYCNVCVHWFCEDCRDRHFARGKAAVMQMIKGKTPGCCGPYIPLGRE